MGVGPGIERGRLNIGGAQISFEARGVGRPVVLVHGGLIGRRVWDPLIAPLSRRFQVVRYDQRGYGESDRPKGPYSYWEDLRGVFDARSIERAAVIGIGSGAAAALDFALSSPARVSALVLISPFLHGYDYSPAFQGALQKLADAYLATGASAVADALMRDPHYPPASDKTDARKLLRELILENAHVLAFNWMLVRPLEPLAAMRLAEVAVPTLVMRGDRDNIDNLNVADKLRLGIPNCRFVPLAGAGHVLTVESPGAITESAAGFINELV